HRLFSHTSGKATRQAGNPANVWTPPDDFESHFTVRRPLTTPSPRGLSDVCTRRAWTGEREQAWKDVLFIMTASVGLGGGRTTDRRRRALRLGTLLRGRNVVGSAYKGAWMGLAIGAMLAIIEPWSYVAAGAIGAACFVGGAVIGAGLHLILDRRSRE